MSTPRPKDNPIEGAIAALIRRIARRSSTPDTAADSIPTRIRSQEDDRLGPAALALLASLPPHMRLSMLRNNYPRLLNRLAAAWHTPKVLEQTVDSLIIDTRGERQGFPFEVLVELTELREYRAALLRHERSRR